MAKPIGYETIPGIAAPDRRALVNAGYADLKALNGVDYAELEGLHGIGKRSLTQLQFALADHGMSLNGEIPEPQERKNTFTRGHTGNNARDIKTTPTGQMPAEYVEELGIPRRVEHGRLLLEIFHRVTSENPVMWGPSMIGYGREGDMFRVGFSPRKAKISLYGLPHEEEFLSLLGKYTTGASCLYVNKPEDIDLQVLEEMIRHAWDSMA